MPPQLGVVAYPNPASGGVITFMVWAAVPSHVTLQLYDLAYEPAAKVEWDVQAGYSNPPYQWSYGRVPPGVYVYRVTILPSGGSPVTLRPGKLTIVR